MPILLFDLNIIIQGAVMTIQTKMLLSLLLITGICIYSMENNANLLQKSDADGIKTEVKSYFNARKTGEFHAIPGHYMEFIIAHKELQAAFVTLKKVKSPELYFELFDRIVDKATSDDVR